MSLSTAHPSPSGPARAPGPRGDDPRRRPGGNALRRRVFGSDSDEPDLARVRRIGARFLGLGLIGYPIVSVSAITSGADLTATWWIVVSVALSVGSGLLLIAGSFRGGTEWLMPLAMTAWLAYLLAVGLWFVAWDGQTTATPEDAPQWMIAFAGMPSMALMLARPRLGVVSLVVSSSLVHLSQQLGRYGAVTSDLLFEIVWSVAFTAVFLAVVAVATRTGRMLDETREDTYRTAANVAAATARSVEGARLDAIVHDRVIASLLAVEPGRPDERLAQQARSALDELAHIPSPEQTRDTTEVDAVRRIRSAAAEISDDADVDVMVDDGLEPDQASERYPSDVVDAVVEAMSEALRNVVRHAGPNVDCAVLVHLGRDAMSMAVVDNGDGFDPDEVPAGRVGIAVSIRGRLAKIVGGHAQVTSRRGRGTTVMIRWERP